VGDVAEEARVDYRLQRRIALSKLSVGNRALEDPCDAHPLLIRAAKHLGEPRGEKCPVCHDVELVTLQYVFLKDGPRSQGGRVVEAARLGKFAARYGDLTVYEVEVCVGCRWNHLMSQRTVRAPKRRAAGAGAKAAGTARAASEA
jgi:hypothetical protein